MLRTCERMGISEHEFLSLPYGQQMRLLAYGWLRSNEGRSGGEGEHER